MRETTWSSPIFWEGIANCQFKQGLSQRLINQIAIQSNTFSANNIATHKTADNRLQTVLKSKERRQLTQLIIHNSVQSNLQKIKEANQF
jgi:hypothetical protein